MGEYADDHFCEKSSFLTFKGALFLPSLSTVNQCLKQRSTDKLGGGSKYFLCSSLLGEMIKFD